MTSTSPRAQGQPALAVRGVQVDHSPLTMTASLGETALLAVTPAVGSHFGVKVFLHAKLVNNERHTTNRADSGQKWRKNNAGHKRRATAESSKGRDEK
jgi:hypothetical protein